MNIKLRVLTSILALGMVADLSYYCYATGREAGKKLKEPEITKLTKELAASRAENLVVQAKVNEYLDAGRTVDLVRSAQQEAAGNQIKKLDSLTKALSNPILGAGRLQTGIPNDCDSRIKDVAHVYFNELHAGEQK